MVQYFLLDQFLAIQSFATSLNELNNQRKQIGQEMLEVAQLQVSDDPFIYIADASFHQGVVGIVAGQLMRLTNRPTAIGVSFDNIIKASVRSNSVDIMSLYQPYTSLFTHFGGHAQAAGLEMPIDHWHILQHETNKTLKQQPINKQLDASTPIPLDIISLEGLEEFEHLAPFGQQFERPLLKLENCIVSATAHHPMGKVYKWRVSSGFIEFDVICFNQVPTQFYQASSITVVGTFKKEVYRNKSKFVFIANELL